MFQRLILAAPRKPDPRTQPWRPKSDPAAPSSNMPASLPSGTLQIDADVPPAIAAFTPQAIKEVPPKFLQGVPGIHLLAKAPANAATDLAGGGFTGISGGRSLFDLYASGCPTKRIMRDLIVHEAAHAHDYNLGFPSRVTAFVKLTQQLRAALTPEQRTQFAYPLSSPAETWAYVSQLVVLPSTQSHLPHCPDSAFGRAAHQLQLDTYVRQFYQAHL